ncbi:MAG: tetratricopeptide repeat protein [Candidatus Cloacimonetes bacterium]|nr:tetratricopeptide repeat protein [Candidatus Cloacimonadota bacterium]
MLSEDKEIAKIYNYLGLAYSHLNNDNQAIHHYKKALEICPNFREAKQNLRKSEDIK